MVFFTLVGLGSTCKSKARLKMLLKYKCSSLPAWTINSEEKSMVTRSLCYNTYYGKIRVSTVDLLVLISLYQLLFITLTLFTFLLNMLP
jgi:hypothetical protein